jgi:secreted trypsin-like serine protease
MEEIAFATPEKKVTSKEKASSYLNSLEGYGDDTDVKVDATKESTVNKVVVRSELRNDDLGAVVDDKSKASYMENLANYADDSENIAQEETVKKAMEVTQKKHVVSNGEPEKLPHDEIVDEIGMAIDAALDDL